MKTRVIQNEPEEPPRAARDVAAPEPRRATNVAARMGRWSAQHRKKAIFGWLAFAIALFAISITSPMKTIIAETSGPGESGRADTILYNDFKQPAGEEVLIQSRSLTTTDPAFKSAVEAVIAGVSKLDAVAKVKSPYDAGNSGFVSADKHSALVRIEIRGPSEDAVDKIDPIVARVAEVQKANPDLYVGSFGESTGKALTASFGDDLKRAGLFSVPLTLIILLIAFGALVAAGIPLLL
jgi:uncharacterized membrane protein YdfJ with MMPL/SSD domain